jgi:hypothetical protein
MYRLDETPAIYVDDMLTGAWATTVMKNGSGRAEPVKMIIAKRSETEYDIFFTGAIDELRPFRLVQKDTIRGIAFVSQLAHTQFLNITIKSRTYIAELKTNAGKLSVLPLSDHFTSKMILSNESLRACVEFHYKRYANPVYDDEFCLRDMVKVN